MKPCDKLAYVQMAALMSVDGDMLREVQACLRPQLAYLPGLSDRGVVADLEKVMTIEKSVLLAMPSDQRIRGLNSDEEVRNFAGCLSRKFSRFAFPDDFVAAVDQMRDRLVKKHGKDSDEGRTYRGLREIRVLASPSWDAAQPHLEFLFVPNGDVSEEFRSAVET